MYIYRVTNNDHRKKKHKHTHTHTVQSKTLITLSSQKQDEETHKNIKKQGGIIIM